MQFSLLCGTAGRTTELERMLHSLANQSFREFEVILVDQNKDDRAKRIVRLFPNLQVLCLSSPPGLCRALNLGLKNAQGDIIGFPDDDCWYPHDVIAELATLFRANPDWDGITLPTIDGEGRPSIARWDKQGGRLTKSNLGFRGCATSIFYRRHVCFTIGGFNEEIGSELSLVNPGADMDYLNRVVEAGFSIQYQPQLSIGHQQTLYVGPINCESKRKHYIYGYGEGINAKRHSLPIWYMSALVFFALIRSIFYCALCKRTKSIYHWLTFRGRIDGIWGRRPKKY